MSTVTPHSPNPGKTLGFFYLIILPGDSASRAKGTTGETPTLEFHSLDASEGV